MSVYYDLERALATPSWQVEHVLTIAGGAGLDQLRSLFNVCAYREFRAGINSLRP